MADRAAECEGALTFVAIVVGCLLPVCFAVKTEPEEALAAWVPRSSSGAGPGGAASSGSRQAPAGWAGACTGPHGKLTAAWRRVEATVELWVRAMCGRSWLAQRPAPAPPLLSGHDRCILCWLLLAVLWVWSTAAGNRMSARQAA